MYHQGIMIKCTSERSQLLNRAEAMKRLKEKLLAIAQDQALADFNEIKGDQVYPCCSVFVIV
jgi:protein subunit release factor A